jgi:hypothetical protein
VPGPGIQDARACHGSQCKERFHDSCLRLTGRKSASAVISIQDGSLSPFQIRVVKRFQLSRGRAGLLHPHILITRRIVKLRAVQPEVSPIRRPFLTIDPSDNLIRAAGWSAPRFAESPRNHLYMPRYHSKPPRFIALRLQVKS